MLDYNYKVYKCFFLLVLFSAFIFLFGWPAFSTFTQGNVMTHTSVEIDENMGMRQIFSPAITFCPKSAPKEKKSIASGWKNGSQETLNVLEVECDEPQTAKDILDCIETKTYALNETILSAEKGISNTTDIMANISNWTWDVSHTMAGRCYTFNPLLAVEANVERGGLMFRLNKSLIY